MKPTIYIVEDNEDIGFVLDYHLTEEGFDVRVFHDLSAFYSSYKIELPDLFLLDVMLPDGDGIQLCRELRTNGRSEMIPILLMSAHATPEALINESCADGFISKPFDLNGITEKISNILKSN